MSIHHNTVGNTNNSNKDFNRNAVHELRRIKNLNTLVVDLLTALNGGGSSPSNLSTEAKQDAIISLLTSLSTPISNIESSNTAINTDTTNTVSELTVANTLLASLLTELELKADLTEVQPVETPNGINTLSALNSTTTGTVTGAYSVSFFNDGAANLTVAGATIAPGLSISFEAEPNHTLDTINYDATGSSILITIVNA